MLVLSRRRHEKIIIGLGKEIVIEILLIDRVKDQVGIGITAPLDVIVHREEVYDRIYGVDINSKDSSK